MVNTISLADYRKHKRDGFAGDVTSLDPNVVGGWWVRYPKWDGTYWHIRQGPNGPEVAPVNIR